MTALSAGLAVALLGPALSFLVVVAGGAAGWVAGRFTAAGRAQGATERDRVVDDKYLESEIRWRWRNAAEGAGLSWLVWTPSGQAYSVPLVLSVRLRHRVLTVRLRPGQLIGDFRAAEDRLCELMAARWIRITPVAADVVTIELW